jgi:gliding motility-associated-like protein
MAIGNNLEYSLNNVDWQQDPVFSNLAEGGYPFVIRDANGCYIVSSFQILSDVVKLSLSDASGCKGNELNITISTDGIPTSKELLSHLNFNHLQLQFEEAVSLHAEIPQNMLTADPTIPGNLFIHYVAGNNFTIPGAADLIELRFTALEEGNSSISWSGNSFVRMDNYEDRPIMTENASIAIDLGTDFSFDGINQACQGDPISIGLIADGAYDALEWYNPSGELLTSGSTLLIPDANYSDGGLYSVILYSNGNCSREKSIDITIELCNFEPGIPNAFRPTSFPPNNTFKPVFGPVIPESFEMMVFNSWGQQIFTTNDFSLGWDGTYKGQPQPQGNYVYVIRYNIAPTTLGSGLTKEVRGSVLLIR